MQINQINTSYKLHTKGQYKLIRTEKLHSVCEHKQLNDERGKERSEVTAQMIT